MARKPNPVYQRGVEEGEKYAIAKSSRKILNSIKEFEKMQGVGPKMMDNIYAAFGINKDLSDVEVNKLNKKWGKYDV